MAEIENAEIVRHVLQKLIDISGRKTTQGHAVIKIIKLISNLRIKYDFLKHVEIKDTRFLELDEPISVISGIDSVKSDDIGKALYDIIKTMNSDLGEDAGHFFIKELKNTIGDDYYTKMEELGLDLGLMQLEYEVDRMTRKLSKN